jgi:hypothetical protein
MVQKELRKLSHWFGKGFRNGMMQGEKGEVFSSSQNNDFPFYLKRFMELFSLSFFNTLSSSFSLSFSLCSVSWWLGGFW